MVLGSTIPPEMQTLTVHVEDEQQGTRRQFVFSRSPVRIGRSPLNDLPLERSFVSHCHAVLHFSDRGCEYVDLGSTNGSYVDGQRVAQNVAVSVGMASTLQIGSVRLRLSRGDVAPHSTRASYAFDAVGEAELAASQGAQPGTPDTNARRAVGAVEAALQSYRAARRGLVAEIHARAAALGEADRGQFATALAGQYPDLLREPDLQPLFGSAHRAPATPAAPASTDLEDVIGALIGMQLPQSLRPQLAARLMQVLQRFAQTYLELQRGRAQFASEMAVSAGAGTALESAPDARTVLQQLFDLTSPDDPLDQLSRSYADLMLHQVALLNGVRAGIGGLLAQLEPKAIARRAPSGVLGWLGRVFGSDGRWRVFREVFEDLQEQKTVSKLVFGEAFARAYAASMGETHAVAVEGTLAPPTGDVR